MENAWFEKWKWIERRLEARFRRDERRKAARNRKQGRQGQRWRQPEFRRRSRWQQRRRKQWWRPLGGPHQSAPGGKCAAPRSYALRNYLTDFKDRAFGGLA